MQLRLWFLLATQLAGKSGRLAACGAGRVVCAAVGKNMSAGVYDALSRRTADPRAPCCGASRSSRQLRALRVERKVLGELITRGTGVSRTEGTSAQSPEPGDGDSGREEGGRGKGKEGWKKIGRRKEKEGGGPERKEKCSCPGSKKVPEALYCLWCLTLGPGFCRYIFITSGQVFVIQSAKYQAVCLVATYPTDWPDIPSRSPVTPIVPRVGYVV